MTLYYIVKRGVYDHGVIGVYGTLSDAKARCEFHTAHDRDDGDGHHDFVIYRTAVGTAGEGEMVAVWKGETVGRREGVYVWREGQS